MIIMIIMIIIIDDRYSDAADEKAAAKELSKAEKQINGHNKKYKEGKSNFFEEVNEFSDIPKDEFEKELEGIKIPPR